MSEPAQRIRVELGQRGYDIAAGPGLLGTLGTVVRDAAGAATGARVVLAFDDGLPDDTVRRAEASLRQGAVRPIRHPLKATESDKSLDRAAELLAVMATEKIDRREPLVALGGGI